MSLTVETRLQLKKNRQHESKSKKGAFMKTLKKTLLRSFLFSAIAVLGSSCAMDEPYDSDYGYDDTEDSYFEEDAGLGAEEEEEGIYE